jgi:hypothetical protein
MQVADEQGVEPVAAGNENDEAAPEETVRIEPADNNDDLSESEETDTSSTAQELGPQNSTENDAEEEGAVGGTATPSTALDDHASMLTQCRQDAREGQEKSRAEMLRTTRES